jgi:hypothetical protein
MDQRPWAVARHLADTSQLGNREHLIALNKETTVWVDPDCLERAAAHIGGPRGEDCPRAFARLWRNSPDLLDDKTVRQIIANAGSGKLGNGNETSAEFRTGRLS